MWVDASGVELTAKIDGKSGPLPLCVVALEFGVWGFCSSTS